MLSSMGSDDNPLGAYLKQVRDAQGLSLRDVQGKTEISNAFLSQIESGKVKNPSPVMLHKLATLYRVPYEDLMERAGYPVPEARLPPQRTGNLFHRFGKITQEEEEQLLDYLGFLRSRARRGKR
ncbi:MAG TPA: helix-turn-helix transcriptional regulator [Bryobacteraceae bacterium]|nr:helix-turn-helix transcriptional regulator [Bryobacteraceae bacterium]